MSAKHTPGPMVTVDQDGRHQGVNILTQAPEFADDDKWPYHPLIGVVYYGRRHAPREVANATARLWAVSSDLLDALRSIATVGIHEVHDWKAVAERMQATALDAIAKVESQ